MAENHLINAVGGGGGGGGNFVITFSYASSSTAVARNQSDFNS